MKTIPKLKIDDLVVDIPVIQGGMSVGISLSGLASAVANAGGIGVIGAAGISTIAPKFSKNYKQSNELVLRHEIQKAKKLTKGPIGVNIMLALTDYDNLIKASIEEEADVILLGAGLFLLAPPTIDMDKVIHSKTKIIPIISSLRAAETVFKFWAKQYNHVPDAIVVEGPLAGGHLGFSLDEIDEPEFALEKILPEIIEIVKPYREKFKKDIPVIPAGGIHTGEDILRFIEMGASGVQIGSRFVATHECDASYSFKETYLNCKKEDIVIIQSPVGMPGRAIINEFIDDVKADKQKPFTCPWKCLRLCDFKQSPYCILGALRNAKEGLLKKGFAFAGKNAYKIDKIISVWELMRSLVKEYEFALNDRL